MSSTLSTLSTLTTMLACTTLKSVYLFDSVEMTGLTDASIKDLCAAVRASKTLRSLDLRNNSLTDDSIPALVQVTQQSQSMQEMMYAWFTSVNYKLFLASVNMLN